jgi:hypothetical protein
MNLLYSSWKSGPKRHTTGRLPWLMARSRVERKMWEKEVMVEDFDTTLKKSKKMYTIFLDHFPGRCSLGLT